MSFDCVDDERPVVEMHIRDSFFFRRSHNVLWIITCYDMGARVACNRSLYSSGNALPSALVSKYFLFKKRPMIVQPTRSIWQDGTTKCLVGTSELFLKSGFFPPPDVTFVTTVIFCHNSYFHEKVYVFRGAGVQSGGFLFKPYHCCLHRQTSVRSGPKAGFACRVYVWVQWLIPPERRWRGWCHEAEKKKKRFLSSLWMRLSFTTFHFTW